jgi:probable F420-dependent oxidoreductase
LPARQWVEAARKVEDAGYATMLVPDHYVGYDQASPLVGAAFAAAATSTLRVGTAVLSNDFKHPAVVAKEAATLDALSDGRFELGMGAGWLRDDYDRLGLPWRPAKERISRLDEALTIIKSAWSGEAFTFEGTHYTIRDYLANPAPVQQPGVPIMVGGGGRRILQLAGRHADIVGINPSLPSGGVGRQLADDAGAEQIDEKLGWVKEGAGSRFDHVELQMRYYFSEVTDHPERYLADAAPRLGLNPAEAAASTFSLVGSVDQICERLIEHRSRWNVSYVVVSQNCIEGFAPVVARLAGR